MQISRRALLEAGMLAPLFATSGMGRAAANGFTHSVASGDPSADSVVLWTRYVTPGLSTVALQVEIAEDQAFRAIVARGTAVAGLETDHCARAVPTGLKPGRWYHYRFTAPGGEHSPIGRTRTLPRGKIDGFRIGVMSCANATSGWFNAYAHAAARDDLDLILHTGDYIYESATTRSDALAALVTTRDIQPRGEAVTLADYRARYASYRRDPALAELHRRFPMISLWDDHEVANNSWQGGARNHDLDEGSWQVRAAAGIRAFREWLPMRPADYASYRIGNLATLARIETRLIARSEQLAFTPPETPGASLRSAVETFVGGPLAGPDRTMMGLGQERWLAEVLHESTRDGVAWQLLANQVIMAPTRLPPTAASWLAPGATDEDRQAIAQAVLQAEAGMPLSLDRWDGYSAARARLLESALRADANLVVISGDSHNAWGYDLRHADRPAGVELAGHSVSSLGLEKRFPAAPEQIAAGFTGSNPDLAWCDTSQRGYMVLDITPRRLAAEWLFLGSRDGESTALLSSHRVECVRNTRRLGR